MVVNQDQRLKSIIISCIPDDIMKSAISCATTKETWTGLVNSFEGLSDTKENKIMNQKLEYNTFRAKPSESLSQTYTRYKTLLNDLSKDGVKLSKHEINVGFVNSLPEKWFGFSQGLRNANHTQILDIADIYGRLRGFQPKFTPKLIHSSQQVQSSQNELKIQKDYKTEYKKEMTHVKVLMALVDDELAVGKNYAINGEWIDITIKKGSEPLTPLPPLKNLQGASPSFEVMPLTYQEHSPRERPGLGTMKHTKLETQESLSKSVSGPVTVSNTESIISSVPT
nr:retrovirus-related Pol polyprotein from transposon TNT 1-94 [Tanacetum cinerariifolium]